MKTKFNFGLMARTAAGVILVGLCYKESGPAVATAIATIFIMEEIIFNAVLKLKEQMPSSDQIATITHTASDIASLKKQMSWD